MREEPLLENFLLPFSLQLSLCFALQSLLLCLLPESFSPQLEEKEAVVIGRGWSYVCIPAAHSMNDRGLTDLQWCLMQSHPARPHRRWIFLQGLPFAQRV